MTVEELEGGGGAEDGAGGAEENTIDVECECEVRWGGGGGFEVWGCVVSESPDVEERECGW